jgi:hypothetical protein
MNNTYMIAALAIIAASTVTAIPQAEALCTMDNPDCCPPSLAPVCNTMQTRNDFIEQGCPVCQNEFENRLYDLAMLNNFRNIEIDQRLTVIESSIAKGDPSPQPSISGVISDGLIIALLAVSITIGAINLIRKR